VFVVVITVANGKPGMAPSDIDSLKQKADELDQQLENCFNKTYQLITYQPGVTSKTYHLLNHLLNHTYQPDILLMSYEEVIDTTLE
jgi:hypothetical protein